MDTIKLFTIMLRIRIFEERVRESLYKKEIPTPCHLYLGEEAVAAGICLNLETKDFIFSNHRSHGHYIAKGGQLNSLMAEIFAKETGCSRGRGGSMHVCAPEVGLNGTAAIVGSGIPMAVGSALGFKHLKNGAIAVPFFGDGATEEGVFHESLLFASFHNLPVLFVIENNGISTHLHLDQRQPNKDLVQYAKSYRMKSKQIDGNDALEVSREAKKAITYVRTEQKPFLLECKVNRWIGHVGPNWDYHVGNRSEAMVEDFLANDPIKKLEKYLLNYGFCTSKEIETIYQTIQQEVKESYLFAINSPDPKPDELMNDIFRSSKL